MRIELLRKIEELSREIRNYPTPIARCDEQLTGLIEERSFALQELQKLDDAPARSCSPMNIWTNDGGFNAA